MTALLSRNHILLLGLCSLLTVLLVYQLLAPPAPLNVPAGTWQMPDVTRPLAEAPAMPSADTYASIDARPLLNPSRQPVASGPAPAGTATAPPNGVQLVGIIIDGDRRLALLRLPSSPLAVSLSVGGDVQGWKVKSIEPDRVVLGSGTSEYVLDQKSNAAPGQSGAPSTPGGDL